MSTTEIVNLGVALPKAELEELLKGRYEIPVVCDNCGHEQVAWIPRKRSAVAALSMTTCLRCEVSALSRKVTHAKQ